MSFFVNIGSKLTSKIPNPDHRFTIPGNYPHSFFLEPTVNREIEIVISRLNDAVPGWDELEPLRYIINLSFSEGVVPIEMKIARFNQNHKFQKYSKSLLQLHLPISNYGNGISV